MKTRITVTGLAFKGLSCFKGYHAALFAGTLLTAMILTGALMVGDSVESSLRLYAGQRLGKIEHALNLSRRYVASNFVSALSEEAESDLAGILVLKGSIEGGAGKGAVFGVNVLGVDQNFWKVAGVEPRDIGGTEVMINRRAVALAGLADGSVMALSVEKPSLLSRDIPLSSRGENQYQSVSLKVSGIIGDDHIGKFSLRAEQVPALNVFMDLERLQALSGLRGKVNMVLSGPVPADLNKLVPSAWRLEHSGYSFVVDETGGEALLESDRIFIEPVVAEVAGHLDGNGVSAYLLNGITALKASGRTTPYSFVLAGGGMDLADDEAAVNQWVADELGVGVGDIVRVDYFKLEGAGRLEERSQELRIKAVVTMEESIRLRRMMPDFPGLSDVESCGDWNIGMPLDGAKVADAKNEEYWTKYRDAPKIVVSAAAGRRMWGNHFGEMTAFRFDAEEGGIDGIRMELERAVDPARLGLFFAPVAEQAVQAVDEAMSFGGLFLSLSFFLIVSAVLLTGLLFSFAILKRSNEIGVLRAVGFSSGRAACVYLIEAAAVALPASLVGGVCGMYYTRLFLGMLNRFWSGAVAGSLIVFDAQPVSFMTGIIVSALLVMGTVLYSVRRLGRKQAVELLSGRTAEDTARKKSGLVWLLVGLLSGISALLVVYFAGDVRDETGPFFASGALALTAGLSLAKYWIDRLASGAALSVIYVGLRNAGRRHERSMAIVTLTALGCFMVFSVACMREDPLKNAEEKWSGTGGFDLIVEFSVPVQDDVLSERGLKALGFREEDGLGRSIIIPVKLRDGDDASCLNLNRARVPVVLGVDAGKMARLGAFGEMEKSISTWSLLEAWPDADGVIPLVVGDKETAMWGLGVRAGEDGDILELPDESGGLFSGRIAAALPLRRSVLQGRVIMNVDEFARKYPSEAGYRIWLVDAPSGYADVTGYAISRRMHKYGPVVTGTSERLEQLYAVENTYMGMFGALGGLGLLLGAVGVGIVALLNILQRRSELALLRAVGFRRFRAGLVVFSEYAFLFIYGVAIGSSAAVIAVWPNVRSSGGDLPLLLLAGLLGGTLTVGLVSIFFAGRLSLRDDLIASLRSE